MMIHSRDSIEQLSIQIDEKLDKQDMTMVKISDLGAKDAYGLDDIPALVYFENGIPELYEGDLRNDQVRDSIQSHIK